MLRLTRQSRIGYRLAHEHNTIRIRFQCYLLTAPLRCAGHRDAQLAALLGVSPQAVSQARRKRKIPEGWVVKVSQQCGLSMDWLMFGKGDESTPVASHAPVASSTSQASTPAGAAVPDLDLLCIPLVAASLSAGVGSLQTEADVLDYFAFRSDWLKREGQSRQDGAHEGLR